MSSQEARFRAAIDREARRSDPKPSRVIAALLGHRETRAWAEDHRGSLLQEASRRLPRQPSVPRAFPPVSRPIDPPQEGVAGVVESGSTQLSGRPIAAEAYTGGGLLAAAAMVEGVYAPDVCEMDPAAIRTLRTNLHSLAVSRDAFAWTPDVPVGGLDLLLGGPPCQPWSAGADLGMGSVGPSSPKNGYPRVLDWIADARPRVLVLENSARVASTTNRFATYFAAWWGQVEDLGYEGVFHVLRAQDFGTPQNRERAFAFLWPKGAPWGTALRQPPRPTHGRPDSAGVRSGRLLPWVRAFDRLTSGCCGGYGLVGCINLGNLESSCEGCVDGSRFQAAPNQTGTQARQPLTPALLDNYAGMFDANRPRLIVRRPTAAGARGAFEPIHPRVNVEYLAPAVTAGAGSQRATEAAMVPEGVDDLVSTIDLDDARARRSFVRKLELLSVREAAKLQDVPQWWAFEGDRKRAYMQVGNGIPVNLGRAVVRHALAALNYPTPIPGSMASLPDQGLWPMSAQDPCGGFPGVRFPGTSPSQPHTPVDPRARPYPTREDYETAAAERRILAWRRPPLWTESTWDEPQMPVAKAYLDAWRARTWRPTSFTDPPPGFWDIEELTGIVHGGSEEDATAWITIYSRSLGIPNAIVAAKFGFDIDGLSSAPASPVSHRAAASPTRSPSSQPVEQGAFRGKKRKSDEEADRILASLLDDAPANPEDEVVNDLLRSLGL